MDDKELKQIWKDTPHTDDVQFNHQQILKDMNITIQKLDRSIKWRNVIEIAAGVFIAVFFGIQFFRFENDVEKFGAALVVPAAFFIIYKLLETRRSRKPVDVSASVKEQLVSKRNYMKREQKLLKDVLYWYLLPLMIPLVIMTLGRSGFSTYSLVYLTIVGLMTYFIYRLNQKGAQRFDPYIEKIEEAIEQLDEN